MRKVVRLGAVGLLLPIVGMVYTAPAPVAALTPAFGFETPSVVDPIHTNGEPDIGIDSAKRVFVSGPTGTGTQRSTWFGSVDGGHSFRVISPGPPPSAIAGTIDPPGGGDTDIAFDRSGTQYFADLYALACLRTAVTKDGGATVAQEIYPAGCSGLPGADRQWLAVYDPAPGTPNESAYTGTRPLIYMEYNDVKTGAQWTKSHDGLTYVAAPANLPLVYAPFGADGYPAIDQVTGKVFQAAGFVDSLGVNSLRLNIGTPNATGDLTFRDAPDGDPSKLITIADNLAGSPDALFSVLSMDSGRNLHAVFAISAKDPSKRQVFVSAASPTTGWTKWTTIQVSQPPSLVNIFPWIKAGGPGRSDAVWYGSDKSVDPSAQAGQAWDVFMAQSVWPVDAQNHVTGAPPATTMVKVTRHPMHYNDVCQQGLGCISSQGNRNLADFFVVTIDAQGAAEIVYDDTSNGLIQPGFSPANTQLVDHAGAGVITIARQSSGLGLFGTPVSGPSDAAVSGLSGPAGDALYPVIGGVNVPGFDLLDSRMSLSGGILTVTLKVADLQHPAQTALAVPGTNFLQYMTRWQMGNVIYYAAMEQTPAGQPTFYAGKAQSVDLCSVSACFPHVLTYPNALFGGQAESGRVDCPDQPSATNPCLLTIRIRAADVGGPTASSLLEEVGSYALAAAFPAGSTTNAQAELDQVPLEIDGVCCYNFNASVSAPPPCFEADGSGHFQGQSDEGDFNFDADACEGDGASEGVSFQSKSGHSFTATAVAGAVYNASANQLVLTGSGIDSGQSVSYTLTAVQAAGQPGFVQLVLSNGVVLAGNVVSGILELH